MLGTIRFAALGGLAVAGALASCASPGPPVAEADDALAAFGGAGQPRLSDPISLPPDPSTGRACAPIRRVLGPPRNDAAHQAEAAGTIFQRVNVPGVTDNENGGNLRGALPALHDFDGDGRIDIMLVRTNSIVVFKNLGCFDFAPHPLALPGSTSTFDHLPGALEGAFAADLNDDGFLDLVVPGSETHGILLFESAGRWDAFHELAEARGVANTGAYNRQIQFGDVNGDGYLDIAVGADQIGDARLGTPYRRLFVYAPSTGRYEDVGGEPVVPEFGGAPDCDPNHDRNAPGVLLRDLTGEGRLDLVQGYHNDMTGADPAGACVTGERTFGIFTWKNVSPSPGATAFSRVLDNGLASRGKLRFAPRVPATAAVGDRYDVVAHGLGLPYLVAFDAFNTGRLDVLAVGPTDKTWHVQSDMISGAFFRNEGEFRFHDATSEVGLESLDWNMTQWGAFFGFADDKPNQFYNSSVVWGDFDNDGYVDFILCDRHERAGRPWPEVGVLRNVLYLNDGAAFHPQATSVSGLDTNSESLEAEDLDGDGLLDLVAGVQPANTGARPGMSIQPDRQYTKVYRNAGVRGAGENHWVEVQLGGLPQRLLIGAELSLTSDRRFLGRRDLFSTDAYKANHALLAHWGLGADVAAKLHVRLPGGDVRDLALPCVDRRLTIDVETGDVKGCHPPR